MCKYESTYFDHAAGEYLSFKCEGEIVKDGFCLFHHPEYWRENPKEVADKFYEKVELAITNNDKLLCVGYNLPDIKLKKKFAIPVYFRRSKFHGKADFSETMFMEVVDFQEATFLEADFTGVEFKEADFSEATFSTAFFSGARFMGKAYFIGLRLVNDDRLHGNDPILIFTAATLNKPEKVHFDAFDLSNISFLHCDVSKIAIDEKVQWHANKKLLDERLADEAGIAYENVATVYHRLRENLESKMRYIEAGRFFIAEMEVRRKNVKTKYRLLKRLRTDVFSALAWYKYFSNYGENYERTILWIIGLPFLAALLTTLSMAQQSCLSQFITTFQKNLLDYILAFFQLKTENLAQLAMRILSLLLMGQLYISLRRQFERRYTKTSL